MKVLRIIEPGIIKIEEKELPVSAQDEIRIKIKYVGFCGSDLSTFSGKNPMVSYPRVPGHEISGIIDHIGPDVPEGFEEGEPVTVVPYTSCGQCASCQRGREYACQYNQTLGVQRDGAMQEYITVPWRKVLKAPSLNELELAMVEPLTVGFHAVSRGRVTDTDVVAVLGCGMIGAGAIIRAALRGATVIAVDIDDHKLEMAKQLGADFTINSSKSDLHNELSTLTRGRGPDVTIEAAGNPKTNQAALNETSFTGRVVFIGYVKNDVELPTKLIVQKELDILGSRNASPQDFRAVISYLEKKNFPTDKLITRKVSPENVAEAVSSWAEQPGKVMKILLDLT